MCDRCTQICIAITNLNSEEGSTVTIYSENPDFEGPNNRVDITRGFGEFDKSYFGESLKETLEKAVTDMLDPAF